MALRRPGGIPYTELAAYLSIYRVADATPVFCDIIKSIEAELET